MRVTWSRERRNRAKRIVFACSVTMAMICASLVSVAVITDTAEAGGPAYPGPQTQSTGPAFFGPAPNPLPYCESPTYFDPFPENVNPIGRMAIGDTASVTTDGITMGLTITSEGNPNTQYPGFFPEGGDGGSNDQPKGIELAEGDGATITLDKPLFYSQWAFTDVDQPNEGFTVTPTWTVPGQAAAFGGDNQFTFAGSTNLAVELDDLNGVAEVSESINGRVQVDFLGAVTGIQVLRTFPSNGQSGFTVGGGCEAAGAAKAVVAGPTWNGTAFDVTYELRMRNNLPSSSTIQAVINQAVGAVGASLVTGTPQGIVLNNLQLTDDLRDPAFSNIQVTGLTTTDNLDLNENFNGVTDFELLDGGTIDAEENAVITLSVRYTPDLVTPNWDDCQAGYTYQNQTRVTGSAANVGVSDLSDDGFSAAPSDNNGSGGVDDPTPVVFDCPPGSLDIVKTVVPGPNGTCPTFDLGTPGDGTALPVTVDDVVTYCISVRNDGPGPIFNVSVTDPQGPGTFNLNDLDAGETDDASYDITVALSTPSLNTATATATDSAGNVGPVSDTALIQVSPKPLPVLEIVKTVLPGANATCPAFDDGVGGLGPALEVFDGETVTYCISVRNTGPGDALNVVISDPQAPQDYPVGTLSTNQGATESYNLTVGLNTASVNVATGSFSGPDGPLTPVTDDAQIQVKPLEPGLQIVKTVLPGANATCPSFDNGTPGLGTALTVNDRDTVTYCVTVRNTGPGIATDVQISDTQAPAPGTFDIGTLGANEAETVSYNVVARLTTPSVNTATATGNGPTGPLDEASDPAQISVDALPDPGLQIVKTALAGPNANCPTFDGGTQGLGAAVPFLETETVTYCISVRNVGPGPATDVTLADDQAPNTFDLDIGDLAVGQEVTRSYDVANLQVGDPTENTAIATGNGLNGPLDPVTDPALISIALQPDPILEIVKTVVAGPNGDCPATFLEGTPGDGSALQVLYTESVTFCISVRNVGGNPATNVQVSDDQSPGVLQLGTIPVGQERSAQYDVLVDATTEPLNTATATGQGPNGQVGPVTDTAVIAPSAQPDPLLEIVKTVVGPNTACPTTFAAGTQGPGTALPVLYEEVVTYCVTVRNIGGNPATDVIVTDAQAPGPINLGTIAINGEASTSYTVTVDANTPTTNTATAVGQGPNGQVGPVSDTAVIAPSPQPDPVLQIVKTVVLGPNGTCPATFEDGIPGDGDPLVVKYGETVTYCVSVRNTAGNPATNVIVTDAQAPSPINLGDLDVGEQASGSYDVTNVDANTPLTNTASATGTGPNGTVGPVTDTAVITPDTAVLEIVKTAVPGPLGNCPAFADGVSGDGTPLALEYTDVVTYCITVKNTGGNPATGVTITDDQAPAPASWDIGTLSPGEEATRSFDVTVDADTPLRNIATANGTGPGNTPIPEVEDPAVITTAPLPDPVLEIVKTVLAGADAVCPAFADGTVGEGTPLDVNLDNFVTYCVSILNSGAGNATDVTISDDQAVDSPYDIGALASGEGASRQYNVQIGLGTPLTNVAVVTGVGPNTPPGETLTASDPAVVNLIDTRSASIELIHSVSKTDECITVAKNLNSLVADFEDLPITWCAKITNTGNVDLTNVTLDAPDISGSIIDVLAGTGLTVLGQGPDHAVYLEIPGTIPDTGLISNAEAAGDPSDADGNLLTGLDRETDNDNANVLEAEIHIESTVIVGPNGDCADSVEVAEVVPGQDVTWCYTVSNPGSTVLRVTKVTDAVLGISIDVPPLNQRLGLTDSFVVSIDTVATGALINDGDVKGKPLGFNDEPLEAPDVEDRDPAEITITGADLSIVKSNSNGGPVPAGTTITYTLVVTNDGPGPAEDVKVTDSLPGGLIYLSVPTAEGWVCALDAGERGFTCLKSDAMEADDTVTLSYRASASGGTPFFNVSLVNTAVVTSSTPDPDETDNTDTSTTSISPPDEVIPTTQLPDPGPFTPAPAPAVPPPDEVLGLAITGAASNLLALLASVMLTIGGLFTVGARRSRDDE